MWLVRGNETERKWLGDLKGFLIDLDGVLYTGTTAIPGGKEALKHLDERGYAYRFISNSTRRRRSSVAEKLHRMGYAIEPTTIQTPAVTAAEMMVQQGKRSCLLLSTGDVHLDFEENGITPDDPHADTVIVADAGDAFTYKRLTEAFRLLLSGGELLALEKDRFWKGDEGLMLSAGPFVAALEFASGKTSRLVGKPAKEFFLQAVRELRLDPGAVAMIGDDISSDILGAQSCGMRGILVKTGKYREDEVGRSTVQPDLIIDSLAALPSYLP
jgi:HAD superfamily hydrolase (TIGR01458 family)